MHEEEKNIIKKFAIVLHVNGDTKCVFLTCSVRNANLSKKQQNVGIFTYINIQSTTFIFIWPKRMKSQLSNAVLIFNLS